MSAANQSLIDLRLLRVFLAVSDSGNMTTAAQRLGLTQSAVSQSLRQLESELKVTLLVREHRPLQLTVAGSALKLRAARLLEEASQLPGLLQELGGAKLPEIRIGLVDSFAATVGPRLIKELLDATVHLSMWSGLSPFHGEALLQRSLDLIVTSDPLDDVDGIERHPLFREPFMLLVPAAQAQEFRDNRLDRLAAEHSLIRYSARSHIGNQIDRHLRRIGIQAPRILEIDTSDTLVAMVAAGLGWAITTPLCFLQGRAHAEGVRPLRLPGPGFSRVIVLLARAGEYAELPGKVASHARSILRSLELRDLRAMIPWLADDAVIGVRPRVAE